MHRAYDDYNAGLLKIGGHTPLPVVPAELRSIKDVAIVARELHDFHSVGPKVYPQRMKISFIFATFIAFLNAILGESLQMITDHQM